MCNEGCDRMRDAMPRLHARHAPRTACVLTVLCSHGFRSRSHGPCSHGSLCSRRPVGPYSSKGCRSPRARCTCTEWCLAMWLLTTPLEGQAGEIRRVSRAATRPRHTRNGLRLAGYHPFGRRVARRRLWSLHVDTLRYRHVTVTLPLHCRYITSADHVDTLRYVQPCPEGATPMWPKFQHFAVDISLAYSHTCRQKHGA